MKSEKPASRLLNAKRNIAFGYAGMLLTAPASFILRTVFIYRLTSTDTLLGINSTYANTLSILSMAELGIGTALNFSLYEPVAKGNISKIKSYMQLYRKAYHVIGLIIAVMGMALVPFLQYLIKEPGDVTVGQLRLYYFIFLFNTVSSYFVAYKYSLVNAEQKNYIQTNILTATKLISVCFQVLVLFLFRSFLAYLLADAAVQLVQKVFVSRYLDRRYPYLKEKDIIPLSKEETGEIKSKTGALILLKVGDVARMQTDALIISSMIAVAVSGLVDNYMMILSTITNFINVIFNSVISGFGNLVATQSKQRQYEVYKVYRMLEAWLFGFLACGMYILISPLIYLWLGSVWILPYSAVWCMITDFYLKGDRNILNNFRTAAGVFEPDKYLPVIMGVVNLILSIWLCQVIGITGIYIGTVVSGLIGNIVRPIKIYRACFDISPAAYFTESAKYILMLLIPCAVCRLAAVYILKDITFASFIVMGIIATIVYNGLFIAVFRKTDEFRYIKGLVRIPGRSSR